MSFSLTGYSSFGCYFISHLKNLLIQGFLMFSCLSGLYLTSLAHLLQAPCNFGGAE